MTFEKAADLYEKDVTDIYAEARPPCFDGLMDEVLKQVGLNNKKPSEVTIVDIGCGAGIQSIALAKKGYKVICVDPSEAMNAELERNIEKAEQEQPGIRNRIKPRQASAHDTGVGEHEADLITFSMVAHWLAADEHAGEINLHWQKILKEGGKAVAFYEVPSLSDPVVNAVHEELTGEDALTKYPHLAKGYQEAQFFVFGDWKKIDQHPNLMLDQNLRPLGYAIEDSMFVKRKDDKHSVDAVLDYFRTITPTKQALKDHPQEGTRLAECVMESVANAEGIVWDCRAYIGEPRMRQLKRAERLSPSAETAGHGLFL